MGVRDRLTMLRERVSQPFHARHKGDWRKCRYTWDNPIVKPSPLTRHEDTLYCPSVDDLPWKVYKVRDCTYWRGNTGYFTDGWCDGTIEFGVVRIPTPKGKLFCAVTWHTDWDDCVVHLSESEWVLKHEHLDASDVVMDVMRFADSVAERLAEADREHWEKEYIAQKLDELKTENQSLRASVLALFAERRRLKAMDGVYPFPVALGAVEKDIRGSIRQFRANVATMKLADTEPWKLLPRV